MKRVALMLGALTTMAGIAASTVPAGAQDWGPRRYPAWTRVWSQEIEQKQENLARRIEAGRKDGTLNYREYERLQGELARVDNMVRAVKSDRNITPNEIQAIRRAQDEVSRHVYQERTDRESAGGGRRGGEERYPAWTRAWSKEIEDTQNRLSRKIEDGRRDGSLSGGEYGRLQGELARVDGIVRRAVSNGNITPEEMRDIREAQRTVEQHINQDRRNRR